MHSPFLKSKTENNKKRQGFSFIELAIVFSVMGLVMSAIWIAYGTIRQNQYVDETVAQVQEIINNARTIYTGQYAVAAFPQTDAALCAANVYPTYLCRTGNPTHPWQGEYEVRFTSVPPRTVSVRLVPGAANAVIPTRPCVTLLTLLPEAVRGRQQQVDTGGGLAPLADARPATIAQAVAGRNCQRIEITAPF